MTELPPITIQEPVAPRRLTRPREGRMLAGVAAGLGDYFEIAPAIYRLAFVALALAGGAGILIYIAAWLVMPEEDEEASIAERALRDRRDHPGLAVGVGLLALGLIVAFSRASYSLQSGNLWLVALLVGGGLVWWELRGRPPVATPAAGVSAPAPRPARAPSLFAPVVGVLLAAAGVLGLLAALGVELFDLRIALAAAVVLVGVAVAAGAATGRAVGGLVALGILLVAALVLALSVHVPFRGKVGTTRVVPASSSALATAYHTAIGDLTIDLSDTTLAGPLTEVDASVGVGSLRIHVPEDVTVVVTGHVQAGDLTVLGLHEDGVDVDKRVRDVVPGAARTVAIDADVGVGEIVVERG